MPSDPPPYRDADPPVAPAPSSSSRSPSPLSRSVTRQPDLPLFDFAEEDDDAPLSRYTGMASKRRSAQANGVHDGGSSPDLSRSSSHSRLDVYATLPMRSTISSREAAYDLDDDELDDHAPDLGTQGLHRGDTEQRMPLLVGLFESSARWTSVDAAELRRMDGGGEGEEPNWGQKGGTLWAAAMNMANSILGAGIIGLPYALNQAGLVTGIVLLVVICAATDWTIRLIAINAKLSGRSSYIEIMSLCFGPVGRAAVSIFQFAFAFGGMCAFGVIIGDTIPKVLGSLFPSVRTTPVLSLLTDRQFVIFICTLGISYPLSLYRDIEKLARASSLAVVGMIIIVTAVVWEGAKVSSDLKGDPSERWSIIKPGVFEATGVISFAFVCHHNVLLLYGSLQTPTLDRFSIVTHFSTGLSLVACLVMSLSGYLVFTDKTQGNILNSFPRDDFFINIARLCFGFNMFATLPLELFVCREVIETFYFSHEAFSPQRHLLFTTALVVSAMIISIITCDLGVVLEITGGCSATALAFIFPAACYLKLAGGPWHTRQKLLAWACAGFGALVLVLSTVLALSKLGRGGDPQVCT